MWHKRFKSPCPASIDFALTFGKLKSSGAVVRVIRRYKDAESVLFVFVFELVGNGDESDSQTSSTSQRKPK